MDDAEENETVGRRKRRSVRLRRRSGIPLVPFNIALESDNGVNPKEEDAVPKENDVYGSLWMDTKEPVVKKKKRRSSMFIGFSAINTNSERNHEQNNGDFVPGLVESSEILSFNGSSIGTNSQNSSSDQLNQGNKMSTAEINVENRTSPLTEDPFDEDSTKSRTENLGEICLKSTKDINAGTTPSNISTKSAMNPNSPDCLDTEQTLTFRSPLISDAFTPPLQNYSEKVSPSSMSPEYPESPVEHLNKTSHEDSYLASAFGKVVGKVVDFVKTSPSYLFGIGADSGKTEASASPILNRRPGENAGPAPMLPLVDKLTHMNGSKDMPCGQKNKAEVETSSSTKDKREVFFDTYNAILKVFQSSPIDKDTGRKAAETCEEMDSDDEMEGWSKDLTNTKDLSLPLYEMEMDDNMCISTNNMSSKPVNNANSVTDQPNTNNGEVSIDENYACEKLDFKGLQNKRESDCFQTDNLKENVAEDRELSDNSTENELFTNVDTCYAEVCVGERTMSSESDPDKNKFNTNQSEIKHVSETTESDEVDIDIVKVAEKRKDLKDNVMTEIISTKKRPTVNTDFEKIATPNSGAVDKVSITKMPMDIADLNKFADNVCAEELPIDNVSSEEMPTDNASTKKKITGNVTSNDILAEEVSINDVLIDNVNINEVLTDNESNKEIPSQNVRMNEEHTNKQNNSNTKTVQRRYKRRSKEYTTLRTKEHISTENRLQTLVEDLDDHAQTILQKKANKDVVSEDSNAVSNEGSLKYKTKIPPLDKHESSEDKDCNQNATTIKRKRGRRSAETITLAAIQAELTYNNKSNTDLPEERADATGVADVGVSHEGSVAMKQGRRKGRRSMDSSTLREQIESFRVQEHLLGDVLGDVDQNRKADSDESKKENKTMPKKRGRKSTDAASLKSQVLEEVTEVTQSGKGGGNSRKRKAEADIFDIEKVYRNKNFVKPEEHRPWHTILESPDRNGETMGKKRLQRFINFEKPTLAKLRRRQQRATKNGWDTNPKKRKVLSDEEVRDKLSVLWAELDHLQPGSPSLQEQLKQFVETD